MLWRCVWNGPQDVTGSWFYSQDVAKLLQLLQGLLTPALLCRDPTAPADPSLGAVWNLNPVFGLSFLVHVDRKGPAVKLQHSLLENRGRGK